MVPACAGRTIFREIINLGGHEVIKINDLIHMLELLLRKNAKVVYSPAHPADMNANWADISKARQVLDWAPKVSLDGGVANLVHWYEQERSWAKDILTP